MTVAGCAPVNVGGIVACGARHVSGSFMKIAKYDQIESAVCDLDSTLSRYALILRVMADAGADLRMALAEADTFHLVSPLQRRSRWLRQWSTVVAAALIAAIVVGSAESAMAADLMATKAPPIPTAYDWTGFYAGGYLGYAWGNSNWTTAPDISGSLNLTQRLDPFNETGAWFAGLQFGYDYMLPNRIVLGAVADATFPSFQNLSGISIGGTSIFNSPTNGPESYSETMLSSGTVRARVGYAPGNWLFYGTGGLLGPTIN